MGKEGHRTTSIPQGSVRLRVGGEHYRCMADKGLTSKPVTLVPVCDADRGYPWWIRPTDIAGIELESGTAYVLDVDITADDDERGQDALRYELVAIVSTEEARTSAIAS